MMELQNGGSHNMGFHGKSSIVSSLSFKRRIQKIVTKVVQIMMVYSSVVNFFGVSSFYISQEEHLGKVQI